MNSKIIATYAIGAALWGAAAYNSNSIYNAGHQNGAKQKIQHTATADDSQRYDIISGCKESIDLLTTPRVHLPDDSGFWRKNADLQSILTNNCQDATQRLYKSAPEGHSAFELGREIGLELASASYHTRRISEGK